MVSLKIIFGAAASVIAIASYAPYYRSIFRNETKPHAFSWLVWTLTQLTAFLVQVLRGGGAGAWVTGFTTLLCFSVFITSIPRGEKNITKLDTLSFGGALAGIGLWIVTKNPVIAVILATTADCLGFVPTARKTYTKPYEELVTIYQFYVLVWFLSLLALQTYNFTTVFYPAVLFFSNSVFVLLSFLRKRTLQNHA